MEIRKARFLISNTEPEKCPPPDKPEYAVIGRSNVGKSSFINMLTQRTSLAKISGKPGKTRLINHFLINDEWYLVDLPGYGYAKTSRQDRVEWQKFVRKYILSRENLFCLFVLIDSRHVPQPSDLDFMEWLGLSRVPFSIIFTKTDKLKSEELHQRIRNYEEKMLERWEIMPSYFISSSVTREGREEILNYINEINRENM